jgi:hypothetical protein
VAGTETAANWPPLRFLQVQGWLANVSPFW